MVTVRILFTGFEAFLSHGTNPTERLVEHFSGEVEGRVLRLEFGTLRKQIRGLIDEIRPDAVVMSGLAGRKVISVEKVAINYADSKGSPYNCGTVIGPTQLDEAGPDAYFSTLPVEGIVAELRRSGVPAEVSLSAGSYGCNQVFYEAVGYAQVPAGFVHVPALPEMSLDGRMPTMDFGLMKRGFSVIFEQVFKHLEQV